MMKRISALLLALVMMLTMTAAVAEEATGTSKGFGGDVTVTVTLTDGVITEVKAEAPTRPRASAPRLSRACLLPWWPATPGTWTPCPALP